MSTKLVFLEGADAEAAAIRRLCRPTAPSREVVGLRELVINGRSVGFIELNDLRRLDTAVNALSEIGSDIRFVESRRDSVLPPMMTPAGEPPTVLVIDRDARLRGTIMRTLSALGVKVVGVPYGASAMRLIRHRPPHVVLLEDSEGRTGQARFVDLLGEMLPGTPISIVLLGRQLRPGEEDTYVAAFAKPLPMRALAATVEREMRYLLRVQSGAEQRVEDLLSQPPAAPQSLPATAGNAALDSRPMEEAETEPPPPPDPQDTD